MLVEDAIIESSPDSVEINPILGRVVERDEQGRMLKGSTCGRPFVKDDPRSKLGGRKPMSKALGQLMNREIDVDAQGIFKNDPFFRNRHRLTIEEVINLALIAAAAKGDVKAIALIYDRLEGKPDQKLDVEQTGELSISWGNPARLNQMAGN
jgi:hypothetical protein